MQVKNEVSEWPGGLEAVPKCPVCDSTIRSELYKDLVDAVFFSAQGKWTMYQCQECNSAYLDPRPTIETIGLAYKNYFTHNKVQEFSSMSFLEKLRRILANGYRNYEYNTRDYPASILGMFAAYAIPKARLVVDAGMRNLPKRRTGRLLDVGCGNGEFLLRARSAGWDVTGVDFDLKAVQVAEKNGLDIRLGGIEVLDPVQEQFDVITMSHIIEHVHEPMKVLKACFDLLKHQGVLWIETPNILSVGHAQYGQFWRGLEPPRHLVLFNLESLSSLLKKVGFKDVQVQAYKPTCLSIFQASQAISKGVDPYSGIEMGLPAGAVKKAEHIEKKLPGKREFITIKAWRK